MNVKTLETIRKQDIPTIGGLVDIAKASADFYSRETKVVSDPGLSKLLSEMADARHRFVNGVIGEATSKSPAPVDASKDVPVVNAWKGLYSELEPSMSDKNLGFVPVLVGSETRLLAAFDKASADARLPAEIKQAVASYLPALRQHQTILQDRSWAKVA